VITRKEIVQLYKPRNTASRVTRATAPLVAKRLAPTGRNVFFENYFRLRKNFHLNKKEKKAE